MCLVYCESSTHLLDLVCFLFWGQAQWRSEVTPVSVLKSPGRLEGPYAGHGTMLMVSHEQGKRPTHCAIALAP